MSERRLTRAQLVDEAQRRRRAAANATNPRVVMCQHNVHWLDCTICSKPAKR